MTLQAGLRLRAGRAGGEGGADSGSDLCAGSGSGAQRPRVEGGKLLLAAMLAPLSVPALRKHCKS